MDLLLEKILSSILRLTRTRTQKRRKTILKEAEQLAQTAVVRDLEAGLLGLAARRFL